MITAILHFILAVFTAFASTVTYFLWQKTGFQDKNKKGFFYFFIFFTGYHLCLSLPFFITPQNFAFLTRGYIFAIVFLFLMCVPMWKLVLGLVNVSAKATKFIIGIFLLIGFSVFLIEIYDFHLPIIHQSGLIIWNANLLAAWLTSVCVGILPFLFGFTLFKNYPRNIGLVEKLKTIFFSSGSFAFSVACVYFIAQNVIMVISAFIFVSLGIILFTLPFLIPKRKEIKIQ